MAAKTLAASSAGPLKRGKLAKRRLSAITKTTKNARPKKNEAGNRGKIRSGEGAKQKAKEDVVKELPATRKVEKKKLIEKRKKFRKPHYDLEKESAALWEKMRQRNLKKEDRSRLISELLEKMKGKIHDMARSHVSSRVLQTCIKYCQAAERDAVYMELRPHFLTLTCNTYAHHLVTKMLDHANKDQLHQMISSLHGNVVTFLRHPVGSAVVEHAYKMANSIQKRELLAELYSPEYRFFKGIVTKGDGRIKGIIANEPASKRVSVLQHMSLSLQPIIEKGIVDHSILHRALVEYLSISSKNTICEIVQQLSGSLVVRMIHTKDGARVGAICVTCGGPKERKKILKGLKGHVSKIACDEYGNAVLLAILDAFDDTKLVNKLLVSELAKELKELVLDKYGRRALLHLLSPYSPRYFPCDVLRTLQAPENFSGPSLQDEIKHCSLNVANVTKIDGEDTKMSMMSDEAGVELQSLENEDDKGADAEEPTMAAMGMSKKDPFVRRLELLANSGLAEKLVDVCTKHAGQFLRSPIGKDVIYEVARGGTGNIMWQACPSGVTAVYKAIAKLAAEPRRSVTDSGDAEEHVFEQYHSSRTIRRLIIDCCPPPDAIKTPSFSAILWKKAVKGKCEMWAKGHSEKVVSAFLECSDAEVKAAAEIELQSLIASGLLQHGVTVSDHKANKRKRYGSVQ